MPNSTTLKNRQGSILYPKTQASITYMSNGNSVEAEINDLRQYEHNDKGYFTTEAELLQEYPNNIPNPESRAGWHAVVGETDTVWIWDVDNNQWFNSGNIISAVTSVNGKVGDITLRGQDINATATRDTTSVTKTVTGHLNDIYSELEETVTTDTDQVITGTKTFTNVIGLLNEDAGQVDQIKHINNNFLITSGSGKNLLNIDEGLETVSAFNRQLAFEDEIEEIQGHYVSYGQQTGKTEAQKAQARANIGAGTSDIDTVKVNGVAQTITNGTVNITIPDNLGAIQEIEDADVWTLDEGWYIFKKYVNLYQSYRIKDKYNTTASPSILGYVSSMYVNPSSDPRYSNRNTKNVFLFCVDVPTNNYYLYINVKSIAIGTLIDWSDKTDKVEGLLYVGWEVINYNDYVTTNTRQDVEVRKNFNEGISISGGEGYADASKDWYIESKNDNLIITDNVDIDGTNSKLANKYVFSSHGVFGFVSGTGEVKTFATTADIPVVNLSNYYTKTETTSALLSKVYPVGSVYMSINNTSPASFLGGTWSQIGAGYALWTATSDAGKTISAGLPNIKGYAKMGCQVDDCSGAMYSDNKRSNGRNGSNATAHSMYFDASRSNDIYGKSTTVQPPAYRVYAWRRTA